MGFPSKGKDDKKRKADEDRSQRREKENDFWYFFIETFWTSEIVLGQVIIMVTCRNGQVGKKVNVEP